MVDSLTCRSLHLFQNSVNTAKRPLLTTFPPLVFFFSRLIRGHEPEIEFDRFSTDAEKAGMSRKETEEETKKERPSLNNY